MRLVVGLFAMFLTASVAQADEVKGPDPKPETTRAKVGLRVVKLLPESHQALLFDKNRGTHVLAEVGGTIDGYKVEDIDDDEVTLSGENGKEIVLAAPEPSWRTQPRRAEAVRTAKQRAKAETAPLDPYAEAPAADAPVDPYDDAPAARSAFAPTVIAPDDPNPPAWVAPGAAPTAAPVTGAPYADAPAPAVAVKKPAPATKKPARTAAPVTGFEPPGTTGATRAPAAPAIAPAPAPISALTAPVPTMEAGGSTPTAGIEDEAPAGPPAPVVTPTVLSRSELNVALGDFNKLSGLIRGAFTPTGARLDVVAQGSVFAKAGLRPGDVVTAVDGKPLRSIDDAAELYVRASATRAANIQVIRAGEPVALRVLIQ